MVVAQLSPRIRTQTFKNREKSSVVRDQGLAELTVKEFNPSDRHISERPLTTPLSREDCSFSRVSARGFCPYPGGRTRLRLGWLRD